MATLIGRVGMVIKGAWDSSVAYDTLDVVTYNNNTYIAKQASPAGTLPTNTTYWQLSLDASLLANKVSGATSGNFAGLDSNGNLKDSGHKHSDYLTSHQDISGKADKAVPAAAGNIASLNSSGNLADSGVASSIIGNTSINSVIPSSDPAKRTITGILSATAMYRYLTTNGNGPGVCGADGMYIIISRHNTDKTAYYFGIALKSDGNTAVVTLLASNKISISGANSGGTVKFAYNGTDMGDNGVVTTYKFLNI